MNTQSYNFFPTQANIIPNRSLGARRCGYLLDGTPVGGNGDVNGDGVISGADVTALYTILLQ